MAADDTRLAPRTTPLVTSAFFVAYFAISDPVCLALLDPILKFYRYSKVIYISNEMILLRLIDLFTFIIVKIKFIHFLLYIIQHFVFVIVNVSKFNE